MGNNNSSSKKGAGYRVLEVKVNSPLDNLLEPYFDFIIDAIPKESPKDILNKLTDEAPITGLRRLQNFMSRIKQEQGKEVILEVFSAKTQTIREVLFVPRSDWGGSDELFGVGFRLQRYDIAQDLFCRIGQVKPNSPCSLAGVKEGEYLVGIKEVKYDTLQEMTDSLYEIFYNKEIASKVVHFMLYSIKDDKLRSVAVELRRKWGGDGLVGCEFLQGHLYRFPKDLQAVRTNLENLEKSKSEAYAMRKQLSKPDAAGKMLAEVLKRRVDATKKKIIIKPLVPQMVQELSQVKPIVMAVEELKQNGHVGVSQQRVRILEERVGKLESMVGQIYRAIEEYNSKGQEVEAQELREQL